MATTKKKPKKIKKISRAKVPLRFLIYSHPGIGKTDLVGSVMEMETENRLLLLNADGPDGPMPALEHGDPDIWTMTKLKDMTDSYDYLRHGGTEDYDWVALDSWTLFEEANMDDIMEQVIAGTMEGRSKASHRNVALPDKPEYLLRQNLMGRWVRHMSKLPVNLIVTAHVMSMGVESDEDEDSSIQFLPAIQGKRGEISSKTCGYFGLVGRLYIVRKKIKTKGGEKKTVKRRVLQVQPSEKFYAKDRLSRGQLGDEIEKPTMKDIVSTIRQSRRKQ
jgi:hypothetical protein